MSKRTGRGQGGVTVDLAVAENDDDETANPSPADQLATAENSAGSAPETQRATVPGKPFEKGKSGNPGGRPKQLKEFETLAREKSIPVLLRMVDIATTGKGPAAVMAAKLVLERAWGKAPQPIVGATGGPIEMRFRGAARATLEAALAAMPPGEVSTGDDGADGGGEQPGGA